MSSCYLLKSVISYLLRTQQNIIAVYKTEKAKVDYRAYSDNCPLGLYGSRRIHRLAVVTRQPSCRISFIVVEQLKR